MKKAFLLISIFILLISTTVFAKPGDIAGVYYSTDINTILNEAEIDSINIGGQTLISAEDMIYFSFNVHWDSQERKLYVDSVPHATNGTPPTIKKSNYPSGMVLGNYFETDIITYLDGKPITAYNIGGRTYIHAEEMRDFGYVVEWNEVDRNLFITSPDRAGYVYTIPLTDDEAKSVDGTGNFSITWTPDKITGTGDADYFISSFQHSGTSIVYYMGFYQNGGLFHSTELQDKLRPLASSGYGVENPCNPAEKYDLVNNTISIYVNGQKAEKVEVVRLAGNGHHDYNFYLKDIPRYKKEDITEIKIVVGNIAGEPFEITPRKV